MIRSRNGGNTLLKVNRECKFFPEEDYYLQISELVL